MLCAPSFILFAGLICWFPPFFCGREYAPKFALRSYFYLLPSVGAARASEAFLALFGLGNDKPQASAQIGSILRSTVIPSGSFP